MKQSRVPVRFCCLEVLKNATVSCSRSFLLSGGVKKCNSLVFPLVFAVWSCQKMQQSRVPARFCCLEVLALEIVLAEFARGVAKMLVSEVLSVPAKGRRVRRLSAVAGGIP